MQSILNYTLSHSSVRTIGLLLSHTSLEPSPFNSQFECKQYRSYCQYFFPSFNSSFQIEQTTSKTPKNQCPIFPFPRNSNTVSQTLQMQGHMHIPFAPNHIHVHQIPIPKLPFPSFPTFPFKPTYMHPPTRVPSKEQKNKSSKSLF